MACRELSGIAWPSRKGKEKGLPLEVLRALKEILTEEGRRSCRECGQILWAHPPVWITTAPARLDQAIAGGRRNGGTTTRPADNYGEFMMNAG